MVKDSTIDVFISKLNVNGSVLEYSTFLGGNAFEISYGIAIDKSGSTVYVTGEVSSTDFDVTLGAIHTTYGGSLRDGFVTKTSICPTINYNVTSNNISCNQTNNGSANIIIGNPSSYIYNWLPLGGNGLTASGLSAGTYTIVVTDSTGCSSSQTFTITQPVSVTASISGDTIICNGQSASLTASGGGTYSWNTNETNNLITVTPSADTAFYVIVSNGSCSDTAYAVINVIPYPIAAINGFSSLCPGQADTLISNGGSIYNWNTSDTTNILIISPVSNTAYNVIVSNGSCSDTAYFNVMINPVPAATITGPDSVCNGQSVTLTAAGGSTYIWNFGAITPGITISPTLNTVYSVIVGNNSGCTDTTQKNVYVIPLPQINISGTSIICEGETTILSASGIGNLLWDNGATANSIYINPVTTSTYFVSASNSCGTASDSLTINVNPLPIISTSNDTSILLGSSALLNASGAISYVWLPPSGLSCLNCASPAASPQSTTTYSVTGTDSNGCSKTNTVIISVDSEFEIFVPDIFSPNNDGQNDVLFVRGYGIKEINFVIYDRLGEKIFETNDQNKGWDGSYKGTPLNNAVFVYYLSASSINGKTVKTKGDITLIR